jgi:hypothetical protein
MFPVLQKARWSPDEVALGYAQELTIKVRAKSSLLGNALAFYRFFRLKQQQMAAHKLCTRAEQSPLFVQCTKRGPVA